MNEIRPVEIVRESSSSPGMLVPGDSRNRTAETLAELEEELCSFVSYPDRCPLFGDRRFRGNCDGRLFLRLVEHYKAHKVADPMMGSGTTRDAIAWLNAHGDRRVEHWGADLSSGFNLEKEELPGQYDFVWLHPPYWDIIRYSNDSRDLSTEANYEKFIMRLGECLVRCADSLVPNGRLAVLLGDVRRDNRYYSLAWDTLERPYDIGRLVSVIIKAQHHCRSNRKTYSGLRDPRIMHETCMVFQKEV